MKIREFQQAIAERLNKVESLVKADCKAMAEDSMEIISTLAEQLGVAGGVAIVVVTPSGYRNGYNPDWFPCDARLTIKCMEKPALNREVSGHITALEAMEIVAHELDGSVWTNAAESAASRLKAQAQKSLAALPAAQVETNGVPKRLAEARLKRAAEAAKTNIVNIIITPTKGE